VYDPESGQLLTGSYMDYAMPRADDLPTSRWHRLHALHAQPAGREGLRRGRCHRLATGGHQRHLTDALGVKDLPMPARPSVSGKRGQRHGLST
jgi:carbon-monoxide dehydrogenase large subunit